MAADREPLPPPRLAATATLNWISAPASTKKSSIVLRNGNQIGGERNKMAMKVTKLRIEAKNGRGNGVLPPRCICFLYLNAIFGTF
jgi:hypothetical protein